MLSFLPTALALLLALLGCAWLGLPLPDPHDGDPRIRTDRRQSP